MIRSVRFVGLLAISTLISCQKSSHQWQDYSPKTQATLGDFEVLGEQALGEGEDVRPGSLSIGFPRDLIGSESQFGAMVTSVSDRTNPSLGRVKLASIPPIRVKSRVLETRDGKFLVLRGCVTNCRAISQGEDVFALPIVSEDDDQLVIDVAALGDGLNLAAQNVPFQLVTVSSQTVGVGFSEGTLVFDVEAVMVPRNADPDDPTTPRVTFMTRWYLSESPGLSEFETRNSTGGVGFFMTTRAADRKIQRLKTSSKTHYYVKNVPEKYQPAFADAFEEWNQTFRAVLGEDLLTFEFVEEGVSDFVPVTGDIRFNVIEWDRHNRAPYGGFGPSVADQLTGQILSANVLVQGDTSVATYREWFADGTAARRLELAGRLAEAREIRSSLQKKLMASIPQGLQKFDLAAGKNLKFQILAQEPPYLDPLEIRDVFEPIPDGVTFDSYMHGYFQSLVAHEIGHNLGLRHNFRGSLGEDGNHVSHSVMEYLGRSFRHRSHVGTYDEMAIAYGYAGTTPVHRDIFCTDEHVADFSRPFNSPECSRDDATSDPFGQYISSLKRGFSLLVAEGETTSPEWTVGEMFADLFKQIRGIGLYAQGARFTGDSWSHFFETPGRPAQPSQVPEFVAETVKGFYCDVDFAAIVNAKETPEARSKTTQNINDFISALAGTLIQNNVFDEPALTCASNQGDETGGA